MSSQHLSRLCVNVFPGGFNWPIFVAIEKGWFTREGITLELQATTGSMAQMTDLAAGNFEIAMTAFDNVVAYVEGQGEAPIGAQPEFFAFLGSDNSFLSLVAQPDISRPADLRGRALSVDAATTGYAFALFDMLHQAGLEEGDYAVVKVQPGNGNVFGRRLFRQCGNRRRAKRPRNEPLVFLELLNVSLRCFRTERLL